MMHRRGMLGLVAMGVALACPAQAKETPVYIELGTAATQEQAGADWQALKRKYPKLLRKLSFNPRALPDTAATVYRIQIGPLKSKQQAFKICAELLAKNDECFVAQTDVEKAVGSLPSMRRSLNVSKPPVELQASAPTESAMPWQGAPASTEGTVAVAEAIRVPLSEENAPATVPPAVPVEAAPAPAVAAPALEPTPVPVPTPVAEAPAAPAAPAPTPPAAAEPTQTIGGVQIGYFAGEQAGIAFWQALREQMPEASEAWHVRTRKPLAQSSSAVQRVMLTVEPVTDANSAAQICDFAKRYASGLACVTQAASAQKEPYKRSGPTYSYRTINASGMSRKEALSMQNPQQLKSEKKSRYAARRAPEAAEDMTYWAQLGSASSKRTLREQWDELQAEHAGVLGKRQPYVNASGGQGAGPTLYRLRTGPFETEAAAQKLCDALEAKKVSCLAVEDY